MTNDVEVLEGLKLAAIGLGLASFVIGLVLLAGGAG